MFVKRSDSKVEKIIDEDVPEEETVRKALNDVFVEASTKQIIADNKKSKVEN